MDLYKYTASELSRMLIKKETSAKEIAESCFKRTDEVEKDVEAYITLNREEALKQAEKADERIKNGSASSPLDGIPLAVKDNMCTEGIKTTCASKILYNFIPPYDATVVKKIKDAGMVITGKANCDEFAMGSSTETSYYKKTKNPHDITRVPGGSSGGSAASVAAGEVPLSVGSDTGGSIRQPSSHCGVVGLKPTYGSVSRYGLIAFASSLDQIGPFSRSIEDAAMLADVIYGHDPLDSTSAPDARIGAGNFAKRLNPDVKGLKIGLPKEYFGLGVSDEVKSAVMNAVSIYEKLGAKVFEISLKLVKYALPVYYIISSAEASSNLARFDGVKYGYRSSDYDGLVDLYVKSRSEGFGKEVQRRVMLGTYVLSSGYYDAYYNKGRLAQRAIKQEFSDAFSDCDLILTPVTPNTAFRFGEKSGDPVQMYVEDICTVSVNIAGIPAIAMPCGKGEGELPVGVQLIGKHFDEQTILNAGLALEKELDLKNWVADVRKA
ncbi:MAG: Asp-tRNA(Asn)/Glu-tRNA(Gln) amidotransferase subunit GatA [Bacillota bacterium]|nr:Asp-tRNA(Asn)/Glu-tRNA(Gln) amidotransferase subunit GatA [Bacillota bacterium]